MLGGLLKNAAALSFAGLIEKVIYVFLVAIIARFLNQDNFGLYTLFLTFLFLGTILATFGTDVVAIREIAKNKHKCEEILGNTLTCNLLLIIVTWPVLILIIHVFKYDARLLSLMMYGGAIIVLTSINQTASAVIRAHGAMGIIMLSSTLYSIVNFILGCGVLLLQYGVKGLVISLFLGEGVRTIVLMYIVQKKFARFVVSFNWRMVSRLLILSLPFALLTISSLFLRKVDLLMVGQMNSMEDVGIYGAVTKFTDILSLLSGSLVGAFYPAISSIVHKSAEEVKILYNESLALFALVGFGVASIIIGNSSALLSLFFGPKYSIGAITLQWLTVAFIFNIVTGPAGTLLLADGKKINTLLVLTIFVVAVNIVLNFLLIPKYSYTGAAMAACICSAIGLIIRFILIRLQFKERIGSSILLLRPAVAGLITVMLCLLAGHISDYIKIVISCICYTGTLAILGEFKHARYKPIIKKLQFVKLTP